MHTIDITKIVPDNEKDNPGNDVSGKIGEDHGISARAISVSIDT